MTLKHSARNHDPSKSQTPLEEEGRRRSQGRLLPQGGEEGPPLVAPAAALPTAQSLKKMTIRHPHCIVCLAKSKYYI